MFKVNKNFARCNVSRTIRFTEGIFNDLLRIAENEQISFNQLVLQCCQFAIDEYQSDGDKDD